MLLPASQSFSSQQKDYQPISSELQISLLLASALESKVLMLLRSLSKHVTFSLSDQMTLFRAFVISDDHEKFETKLMNRYKQGTSHFSLRIP